MQITIYCPMADHPEYRMGQMETPGMVGPEWTGEVDITVTAYHKPTMVLEQLFRLFNRVEDGDGERLERMGYKLPSLSSGDVVTMEGKHYLCASAGWKVINDEELARIKANPQDAWMIMRELTR